MKKIISSFLTLIFSGIICSQAFSAGWTTDYSGRQVYIQDDGTVVKNSWIKSVDTSGNVIWYYAKADGSLRTDGWETVSGNKYYFDDSGVMQTGWIDDYEYYCDPVSGAAALGWKNLVIPEDMVTSYSNDLYSSGDEAWFYFNPTTGKKLKSEDQSILIKSISGIKYGFDYNGIMRKGWAQVEAATPEIAGYVYFSENTDTHFKEGQLVSGTWYTTMGPTEDNDGNSISNAATGDVEYFYFKSNGRPSSGNGELPIVKSISGKKYLFNDYGNPVYGIRKGIVENKTEENYYYCGSSKTDCSVRTGKMSVTQGDGEKITFYADSAGRGVTGVKDNYVYYCGRLQKADSSSKYMIVNVNDKDYVINANGQIQKNKTKLTDGNGSKVSTYSDGTLKEEIEGSFDRLDPEAPVVDED